VIFGELTFDNSLSKCRRILYDKSLLEDQGFYLHRVDFEYFSGGVIFNKKLPYVIRDSVFINETNDILVLLNGVIYNRLSVCNDYDINVHSPEPEIVFKLFQENGCEFVCKLNGDFIIIIYTACNHSLFIFRDHVGVRPVSYTNRNGSLFFSSDSISLCKAFNDSESIDPEPFLSEFRFADLTRNFNPVVHKLLPGHYLKSSQYELTIVKYWHPERIRTDYTLKRSEWMADIRKLCEDAAHIRCDQRFNASAHVSGGLDSSYVASSARKEYKNQNLFYGYSWSPANCQVENVKYDERDLVKRTCKLNDIEPVFINLNIDDIIQHSKNYIRTLGSFAEEKILNHAQKERINLIFTGWGGDEFLSKGERGINSDLIARLNWGLFFKRNPISSPKKFLKVLLYDVFFPAIHVMNFQQRKSHKSFTRYLKKPFRRNHRPSLDNFLFYRSRRQLHLGLLYYYHIPDRTEKWYLYGFSRGVEYRYPLLDKRIIEHMIKIPSRFLIDGKFSRMILRELSKGYIPEEVRWVNKGPDPILVAQTRHCLAEFATILIEEIKEMKTNDDLYFIDFEVLEKDAKRFTNDSRNKDILISNLLLIKQFQEFLKYYKKDSLK